jgi:hypothetical protein
MRKVLGPLGATMAIALVMTAGAGAAGAMHSGSKGCATKESCATGGLGAAVASTPDAAREAPTSGVHDAGDHIDFSLPRARAAAAAGVTAPSLSGVAVDPDGLEGVLLPVNDAGSVSLGKLRTPDAPGFGFDVSVQAASVRFPYFRYPPFPHL